MVFYMFFSLRSKVDVVRGGGCRTQEKPIDEIKKDWMGKDIIYCCQRPATTLFLLENMLFKLTVLFLTLRSLTSQPYTWLRKNN